LFGGSTKGRNNDALPRLYDATILASNIRNRLEEVDMVGDAHPTQFLDTGLITDD